MTGMEPWRVHKFGGSSVADAACMERVAAISRGTTRCPAWRRSSGVPRRDRCAAHAGAARAERAGGRRRRAAGSDSGGATAASPARCSPRGRADEYVEELTASCREIAGILQTVRLIRVASPVVARPSSPASARSGRRASSRATSGPAQAGDRRGALGRRAGDRAVIDQAPLGPEQLWPEVARPTPTVSSARAESPR
jgi:hypothetical protein